MGSGQMEAPCGVQADTGRGNRHATAAGNPKITQAKAKRYNGGTTYTVRQADGDAIIFRASGRIRWALDNLRKAGGTGCTPILQPAPRWSAYIHSLREMGVAIETIYEKHDGDFPGHHGRYVLRCEVTKCGAA